MANDSAGASAQREPATNEPEASAPTKAPPPFFSKIAYATRIYGIQSFVTPVLWFNEWREYFYPPDGGPNIVKAYECRPNLPIR